MLVTCPRRCTTAITPLSSNPSHTNYDESQYPGPKSTSPTGSIPTPLNFGIAAVSAALKSNTSCLSLKAADTAALSNPTLRVWNTPAVDPETNTPASTPSTPSPDPIKRLHPFLLQPGIRAAYPFCQAAIPSNKADNGAGIISTALPAEPLPLHSTDQNSNHLALNYHPAGPPVARQQQYDQLSEILVPALSEEQPPVAVYVCGPPGTGKTFTVSKFTNTICQPASPNSPSHLWVNCANLSNPRHLFPHIVKALSLQSEKNASDAIRDYATTTGPALLIVLDEVDFLTSNDQMVLYFAFEWPKMAHSRISVVGIANSIDLPSRLLPWLRQSGCMPEILHFTSYSSADLQHIVEQRLGSSTSSSLPLVSLAAKKVAAGSGDARLMLDVCQEAKAAMIEQNKKSGISIVSSIISRRGGLSAAVDTIKQLPVQQQLALCVAANAVMFSPSAYASSSRKVNRKATLGGLYHSFVRMCERAHVSCLSFPEFADMCCNSLVHHGLVDVPVSGRVKGARTLRGRPIRLRVPVEDVRAGVADKGFLPMLLG